MGICEQLCGADAVTYADEGTRHLRSKVVYHVQEISGVVGPRCWGLCQSSVMEYTLVDGGVVRSSPTSYSFSTPLAP